MLETFKGNVERVGVAELCWVVLDRDVEDLKLELYSATRTFTILMAEEGLWKVFDMDSGFYEYRHVVDRNKGIVEERAQVDVGDVGDGKVKSDKRRAPRP